MSASTLDQAHGKKVTLRLHEASAGSSDVIVFSECFPNITVGDLLRVVPIPTTHPVGPSAAAGDEADSCAPHNPDAHRPQSNSRRSSVFTLETAPAPDPTTALYLQVTELDHSLVTKATPLSVATTLATRLRLTGMTPVLAQKVDPAQATARYVELQLRHPAVDRADLQRLQASLVGRVLYHGQTLTYLGYFGAEVCGIRRDDTAEASTAYVTPQTRLVFRTTRARFVVFVQVSRETWEFLEDGTLYYERALQYFLNELFRRWQRERANHFVTLVLFARYLYTDEEHVWVSDVSYSKELNIHYRDYYKVISNDALCSLLCPNPDTAALLARRAFLAFNADVARSLERPSAGTMDSNQTSSSHESGRTPESIGVRETVRPVHTGRLAPAMRGNVLEAINLAFNGFERPRELRDAAVITSKVVIVTPSTGVFDVPKALLRLTTQRALEAGLRVDVVCLAPQPLHRSPVFRFQSAVPPSWRNAVLYGDTSEADFRTYEGICLKDGLGRVPQANPDARPAYEAEMAHFPWPSDAAPATTTAADTTADILYYDEGFSAVNPGPAGAGTSYTAGGEAASPSYFAARHHPSPSGSRLPRTPAETGAPFDPHADYWFYLVPWWVDASFYQQDCLALQTRGRHRFQPYCRMPEIQTAGTGQHLRIQLQVPYLILGGGDGDDEFGNDPGRRRSRGGSLRPSRHRAGVPVDVTSPDLPIDGSGHARTISRSSSQTQRSDSRTPALSLRELQRRYDQAIFAPVAVRRPQPPPSAQTPIGTSSHTTGRRDRSGSMATPTDEASPRAEEAGGFRSRPHGRAIHSPGPDTPPLVGRSSPPRTDSERRASLRASQAMQTGPDYLTRDFRAFTLEPPEPIRSPAAQMTVRNDVSEPGNPHDPWYRYYALTYSGEITPARAVPNGQFATPQALHTFERAAGQAGHHPTLLRSHSERRQSTATRPDYETSPGNLLEQWAQRPLHSGDDGPWTPFPPSNSNRSHYARQNTRGPGSPLPISRMARPVLFVTARKADILKRQFSRWQDVYVGLPPGVSVQWPSLVTPAYLPLTTDHPPDFIHLSAAYMEYPSNLSPDAALLAGRAKVTATLPALAASADRDSTAQVRAVLCDLVAARVAEGFQITVPPRTVVPTGSRSAAPALSGIRATAAAAPSLGPPNPVPTNLRRWGPRVPHESFSAGPLPPPADREAPLDWNQLTGLAYRYVLSNGRDYHHLTYHHHTQEITTKRYQSIPRYRRDEVAYQYQLWGTYSDAYVPQRARFRYADRLEMPWNVCDQLLVDPDAGVGVGAYSTVRLALLPLTRPPTVPTSHAARSAPLTDEERRIAGFQLFLDHLVRLRRAQPAVGSNLAATTGRLAPDALRDGRRQREPASRSALATLDMHITTKRPSAYYEDLVAKRSPAAAPAVTVIPTAEAPPAGPLTPQVGLAELAAAMLHPTQGLRIAIRRWHWRLYAHAFVGQDLVDWLLACMPELDSRERAVAYAQELLQRRLFVHCRNRDVFLDDMMIYQLTPAYLPTPARSAETSSQAVAGTGGVSMQGGASRARGPMPVRPTEAATSRAWFTHFAARLYQGSDTSSTPSPSTTTTTPLLASSSSAPTRPPADRPVLVQEGQSRILPLTPSTVGMQPVRPDSPSAPIATTGHVTINADAKNTSDRTELAQVEYDRVYVSGVAYHLSVAWLGCTAPLIEELIGSWARLAERWGHRLVKVPARQLTDDHLVQIYPFLGTRMIRFVNAPSVQEIVDLAGVGPDAAPAGTADWIRLLPKYFFEEAVLQALDFVLDHEPDSQFPANVKLHPASTASASGRAAYTHLQYIHRSGLAFVQIRGPGRLLWVDNPLHLTTAATVHLRTQSFVGLQATGKDAPRNLAAATHDGADATGGGTSAGGGGEGDRPTSRDGSGNMATLTPHQEAAALLVQLEAFCHDPVRLSNLWRRTVQQMTQELGLSTLASMLPETSLTGLDIEF
ncbi:vacuolar membrane-associated protein iml1 [Tieghemiomyces parasiticus]|uniref:Vacuolar membrane-associated protein IML1 n=1 Tax=Tieghemiomyces parasiticus TaxID=78921 RepID=A0A9W8ADU4_9FUNG|nr:vacuolar membrane-associated protein iml1 [Tieghemiomyces parasiticus]